MTEAYVENMTQAATYWAPGASDGYGASLYATPVPLICRWQDSRKLFRDAQGREQVSDAIVYTSIPVAVGGRLYLGTDESDSPPAAAKEIRDAGISPSLDGDRELHKAIL